METGIRSANIILYCRKWTETLVFYKDVLKLEPLMSSEWFVEFSLGDTSRLSVADETRASVKSSGGQGITMALEVDDLDEIYRTLDSAGAKPTPIREHPWNAHVFYVFDPEGHRIEFWKKV